LAMSSFQSVLGSGPRFNRYNSCRLTTDGCFPRDDDVPGLVCDVLNAELPRSALVQ
jgi:hypothetical protein